MKSEREPMLGTTEFKPTMDPNALEIINPDDGKRIGTLLWDENAQFRVEFSTPNPILSIPLPRLKDITYRASVVHAELRTKWKHDHPNDQRNDSW